MNELDMPKCPTCGQSHEIEPKPGHAAYCAMRSDNKTEWQKQFGSRCTCEAGDAV